jgi:hypothetical protein
MMKRHMLHAILLTTVRSTIHDYGVARGERQQLQTNTLARVPHLTHPMQAAAGCGAAAEACLLACVLQARHSCKATPTTTGRTHSLAISQHRRMQVAMPLPCMASYIRSST